MKENHPKEVLQVAMRNKYGFRSHLQVLNIFKTYNGIQTGLWFLKLPGGLSPFLRIKKCTSSEGIHHVKWRYALEAVGNSNRFRELDCKICNCFVVYRW
ncbi:hypothetical protein SDJN03_00837, partial [Cucurbita argyrosperma subsp. sororia]